MYELCNIPPGTICDECLYEAKVCYLEKQLCFRCYSVALLPPKIKPQSERFVDSAQSVLPLTSIGR